MLIPIGIINCYGNEISEVSKPIIFSDTLTNSNGYVWPIEGGTMSQGYKYYGNPNMSHRGIDISAPYGTTIKAICDGTVVCASTASSSAEYICRNCNSLGAGYHVVILQSDGYFTMYSHMSAVSVAQGKTVNAGQKIGEVGSTGNSTGNHLHFAIHKNRNGAIDYDDTVDPMKLLTPFKSVYLENISPTEAVIHGDFGVNSIPISSGGFYFGTSIDNMQKIDDTIVNLDHLYNNIVKVFFNTQKYYGSLESGTKYYYQIWLGHNLQEYRSDVYSFVAGKDNSNTLEKTDPTNWYEYPSKAFIEEKNAGLAQYVVLNGASNADVSTAGIYVYDTKGNLLTSKTEGVNITSGTEFWIFFNVQNSLGYTLSPNTTYKYKFMAIVNGKTCYSPELTFTTLDHTWNSGTIIKAPSCDNNGTMKYTCITCQDTKQETIPATNNHIAGSWTVTKAASCSDIGTKVQKCTDCNKILSTQSIDKTNHNWNSGAITSQPTCTSAGVKTYTCQGCSTTQNETVAATGLHNPGNWTVTKASSCTETGVKTQKCTTCDKVLDTESIDKTNHNWNAGIIATQPTCTSAGVKTFSCQSCSSIKTETIAATGIHVFASWQKVDNSTHKHICTQCNRNESAEHHWDNGEITKKPTDTLTGITTYTCTDCSATKTEIIPSTHVHKYIENWNCDQNSHWLTCSCGAKSSENPHIPGNAATETTSQNCTVCNYIIVPALGHTHSYNTNWVSNDKQHWKECVCGNKNELTAHIWNEGIVTVEPTTDRKGQKVFTCTICGNEKIVEIDQLLSDTITSRPIETTTNANTTLTDLITASPITTILPNNPEDNASSNDSKSDNIFIWVITTLIIISICSIGFVLVRKFVIKPK